MKILITGGAGFIGSHLAFSLEGLGNEITVLDNMTTGSSSNLQGFEGLSALEESAVRLHEIYKSLMTGGFTEDEALSLIAKMTKPNSE